MRNIYRQVSICQNYGSAFHIFMSFLPVLSACSVASLFRLSFRQSFLPALIDCSSCQFYLHGCSSGLSPCLSFLPVLPAYTSCLSFLPVLPACPSYLFFLPVLPACSSCLYFLPVLPACSSCPYFLPVFPACSSCLYFLLVLSAWHSCRSFLHVSKPELPVRLVLLLHPRRIQNWNG